MTKDKTMRASIQQRNFNDRILPNLKWVEID